MNLLVAAPLWLILLLIGAITVAAIEDAIRLRIHNVTCAMIAAGAVGAMIAVGPTLALWQNLLVCAIILALGTAAFAGGLFGGGDVKLLAAIGLWLDLRGGSMLFMAVLLAGGLVAVAYLAANMLRRSNPGLRSRRIPYGIAIALGTLLTLTAARMPPPASAHSAQVGVSVSR
jgi:prepilin peptidase CpaA